MDISKLIRKPIQKMSIIKWGKTKFDGSFINLKFGENPYKPSRQMITDIQRSLSSINRYPNLRNELLEKLSKFIGIDESCLCLANGGDKIFRLIAEVFIDQNDEAITFTPSFPIFDSAIEIMGGKVIKILLEKNYVIPDIKEIKKRISLRTKIIYVCNPNNPTGNFIATIKQIEELLRLNIIVVVDEAYIEFSNRSVIKLINKYQNLIILRSFSKTFGLAGIRVAYTISSKIIAESMKKIEDSIEPFNIATPSYQAAICALKYIKPIEDNIQKINSIRTILISELNKLGILTFPSYTSFILFNLKNIKIKTKVFIEKMEKEKIILKDASIYPGLSQYDVYMAVPRDDQLNRVINSIKKIISS